MTQPSSVYGRQLLLWHRTMSMVLRCPDSPVLLGLRTTGRRVKVGSCVLSVLQRPTRCGAPPMRLLLWTMLATCTLMLLIMIVKPQAGRLLEC